MKEKFQKIGKLFKTFPKKHHIEYVSALLSIPVILSVLVLNYSNLEGKNKTNSATDPTPASSQNPIIIQTSPSDSKNPNATSSSSSCKKEIGPITIESPKEEQTINDNPVCIIIKKGDDYCSSVWSYKINSGNWSDYNSSSPCLYNLPDGDVKFTLRVQSTVSSDTTTIERNFTYESSNQITPTATSSASQ